MEAFGLKDEVAGLCPGRTWHDALYDACACAVLAVKIGALRVDGTNIC